MDSDEGLEENKNDSGDDNKVENESNRIINEIFYFKEQTTEYINENCLPLGEFLNAESIFSYVSFMKNLDR